MELRGLFVRLEHATLNHTHSPKARLIQASEDLHTSMSSGFLTSVPFILHIVIELPAALSFALFPSATLSIPQPHAQAVIRQYALLLLSTIIIAAVFVQQNQKGHGPKMPERGVASALALYHLGPLVRAVHRFGRKQGTGRGFLGQPWLHVLVHVLCCLALGGRGWLWW